MDHHFNFKIFKDNNFIFLILFCKIQSIFKIHGDRLINSVDKFVSKSNKNVRSA